MANFAYTNFKRGLMAGEFDLASDDIRVLLVMTNTTADTEKDVATFGDFTTLDEFDGANYTSLGIALTGEAVTADDANDRGEFDAVDVDFPALGPGTRQIQAGIAYKFVTDLASSIPLAYIDSGGFPLTGIGGNVLVTWNEQGILQTT